jgi:hypothetical protein
MSVQYSGDKITFADNSVLGSAWTGFKNRIINGAMMIDQRNAGASVTPTDGQYTLDRWLANASQSSKFTVQQTPSATETGYATRVAAGFTNYLAVTSSAATSVGASDYFDIRQVVEGFNISDLAWGTANASPVTLSFWVRSSLTGTFGGSLVNGVPNLSYPFSYSISAANTWEQKTITITGPTTGTWNTNNTGGIRINFGLGVGSTLSGTAGAWVSGNLFSTTGATSVVGTSGATFYITGVQLEKGSTATSFDYRPYGTELALCQRYFYQINPITELFGYGYTTNGSVIFAPFPVPMRTTPTGVTATGTWTGFNATNSSSTVTSFTWNTASVNSASLVVAFTVTAGTPSRIANNTTGTLSFTGAEL